METTNKNEKKILYNIYFKLLYIYIYILHYYIY